jgi:TolB-like protein
MSANASFTRIKLAVLPFEEIASDGKKSALLRGLFLDILGSLSKFRQLDIVYLRTAWGATDFRNGLDSDSGVHYRLEGTLQLVDPNLFIHLQLFESNGNRLIWADKIQSPIKALNEVQSMICSSIVASLQLQLDKDLKNSFNNKHYVPSEPYFHYLLGMEAVKEGNREGDHRAREHFEKAITLSPSFAKAYAGMSLTYFNEWSCQLWDRWEISQSEAFLWAEQAVKLDDQDHVSSFILGRLFLYKGAYETAEYYLQKSIQLNDNDPESLIQIASCMVYLGKPKDAYQLYQRVLAINPNQVDRYNHIGVFILLELGEYEKAKALMVYSPVSKWIDIQAIYAAIHLYIGDLKSTWACWGKYLAAFQQVIKGGKPTSDKEALEWMIKVNPFKERSNLWPFWEWIAMSNQIHIPNKFRFVEFLNEPITGSFRINSELCHIGFDEKEISLKSGKGLYDIQKLLQQPEEPIHCMVLMGAGLFTSGENILDQKAITSYKEKVREIKIEMEEADAVSDYHRMEMLQESYEQILDQLSGGLGHSGKARKTGSSAEKSRAAVTWRIRNVISKIELLHPHLGKHFSNSIKTGNFCVYRPERKMEWTFE